MRRLVFYLRLFSHVSSVSARNVMDQAEVAKAIAFAPSKHAQHFARQGRPTPSKAELNAPRHSFGRSGGADPSNFGSYESPCLRAPRHQCHSALIDLAERCVA